MALRTHGPHARHDFDARLRTGGTFENVDAVRLEERDHVDLLNGGQELAIHFETFDFTDGVNFTLRDAHRVHFALRLDHGLIGTDRIFVGPNHLHPDGNPFVLRF